jgi:hypothetical protein
VGFVVSDPILEGQDIAETDAEGNVIDGSSGLDPNEYDYWRTHVFEGVPTAAARDTDSFRTWVRDNNIIEGIAVPYAKVVQGANSTGLAGKVTPFFDTILGRYHFYETDVEIPGGDYVEGNTGGTYQFLGPAVPFEIPWWATRVKLKVFINGAYGSRGSGSGRMSGAVWGRTMRQQNWSIPADPDRPSHWVRENFIVSGDMFIPEDRRGGVQNFRWAVTNREAGTRIGITQNMSHMFLEAHFFEDLSAVDNSEPI